MVARSSGRRLDFDADHADLKPVVGKGLQQAGHQLSQLGGCGGVFHQQAPFGAIQGPGFHMFAHGGWNQVQNLRHAAL